MELNVAGQPAYAYTGGKPFDPALPCAVFVHGAQNDHSVWALQTRWFANHGFSVLAVDLPGHNRSQGTPSPRAVDPGRGTLEGDGLKKIEIPLEGGRT